MKNNNKSWDAFISYASEDRLDVAEPLYNYLKGLGVSVWFDQTALKVGDSLRRKIDQGLQNSKYGIVILSPFFFRKHFTKIELDGLAQREAEGRKVILPIWYNIDTDSLRKHSITLADRVSLQWKDGLENIAIKLLEVIRPDIIQRYINIISNEKLEQITTGEDIGNLVSHAEMSLYYYDKLENDEDISLVASFLDELRDWVDIWNDLNIQEQEEAKININRKIDDLYSNNWTMWGGRRNLVYKINSYENKTIKIPMRTILVAIVRNKPNNVLYGKKGFVIER